MKKWWKKLLGAFLIVLLAVGGYIVYELNFKTYETADKEVKEITDSEYEIDLPDITESSSASDNQESPEDSNLAQISEKDTSTNSKTPDDPGQSGNKSSEAPAKDINRVSTISNKKTEASESIKENGTHNIPNAEQVPSVASIKSKYEPVFESLEAQANSKINSLAAKAFNEYIDKKQNKEQVSYGYFYTKYTSAAETLEANTDSAFNMVYSALQADLKRNGFSPSHAVGFKEQYDETKKERKNALLKKATSAL